MREADQLYYSRIFIYSLTIIAVKFLKLTKFNRNINKFCWTGNRRRNSKKKSPRISFLQKDWIGFQVYSLKISPSNFNFESNTSPIHFTRNLSRLRNQFSDPEITNFKFSSRILNSRVSLENASQRNFHLESIESMAHIIWKWNNKSVSFPRNDQFIQTL